MSFRLLSRPAAGNPLSVWGQLADIDEVDGELSSHDRQFLSAVGKTLASYDCATRFAVTLLHSHFTVSNNEALVESVTSTETLETLVLPLGQVEDDPGIVPRSWMFSQSDAGQDREDLNVLTWIHRKDLPQANLGIQDQYLIAELAKLYRFMGVTDRFGMALSGPTPREGMIWTEDTDADHRHLLQTQRTLEEVTERLPIMTMYTFNRDGSFIVTLGCCTQGPSGRGHMGTRHPWGVKY